MPLTRLPLLAAALLALALAAGPARAEQVTITGQTGSPLTTTDNGANTITGTTRLIIAPGLSVSGANGVVTIGPGPLLTSCGGAGGAPNGAAYNRSGAVVICNATALTWGGLSLTWGGVPITGL